MAKITEVVRSTQARVNIGDYQGRDFFASMKGELEDGDPDTKKFVAELAARMKGACDEMVLQDLREHFATRGKKYTDDQIRKMFGIPKPKESQPEFG